MNAPVATELFPGFAWAVPTAFAAAISSFRFEQGDVLYREARGYASLSDRVPDGLTAIQVRQPTRSGRAVPSEYEGDRRLANWRSEVELDRFDLATGAISSHTTTQGRLFVSLWRGSDAAFESSSDEPPLPRSVRELAQVVREGALVLPRPDERIRVVHRFAFAVDLASDASRAKAMAIRNAISSLGPITIHDASPVTLGVEDAQAYPPTLVVQSVFCAAVESAAIAAALKRVLYAGSGESERFTLARHGRLEALEPAEDATATRSGSSRAGS